MRGGGTVNADGFGIGWYTGSSPEPALLRRAGPMWTDAALPRLAAEISSGAVLAAVRSATVGMPVVETACAPFTDGPLAVQPQRRGARLAVVGGRARVDAAGDGPLLTLDAPTDAALLWALLRRRLAGR